MTAELQEPSIKEDRQADGTPATRAKVERVPVAKTKGCLSGDLPKGFERMAHKEKLRMKGAHVPREQFSGERLTPRPLTPSRPKCHRTRTQRSTHTTRGLLTAIGTHQWRHPRPWPYGLPTPSRPKPHRPNITLVPCKSRKAPSGRGIPDLYDAVYRRRHGRNAIGRENGRARSPHGQSASTCTHLW